jgi:hypothetical protein
VFPRFQYGTGANHLQPFVLAHHLRATLQAAADLALDEGLRLTVVGWHGADLDYIEVKAGPTLALPRADGRTAVVRGQ